jgi:hypothetical protein
LSIETSPRWPYVDQEIVGIAKMHGPLPDWVCMGYEMIAVGDGIPLRRRAWAPAGRLSCRKPEWKIERFYWRTIWDGTYKVFGWTERDGKRESFPFPIEMVVR